MIKYFVIIFFSFLLSRPAKAQEPVDFIFRIHQTGIYFVSDRISTIGAGLGTGLEIIYDKNIDAQLDANIIWGNGNAASARLALGYKLQGKWSPAIFTTFGLLFGQRTEVLSDNGSRPKNTVWLAGLRINPLRFERGGNYISMLELGYGIGPDNGTNLEIEILSFGISL